MSVLSIALREQRKRRVLFVFVLQGIPPSIG
jgi:hypothetical protein